MESKKLLGTIVSGAMSEGFMMRIDGTTPIESIKTGKFVSIQGNEYTFFSLITDLKLDASHPEILLSPPSQQDSLLFNILKKHDIYATAHLRPMVMVDRRFKKISPVKTIPAHFAQVLQADEEDVSTIFGKEEAHKSSHFNIGTPLDMVTPVCINLDKLTERSNGIFGKTGTGKTFLTRLVLAGLIKHEKAVCLIFDMHSEYGIQARKEGDGHFVKGLKTLFPAQVSIFSLDPVATARRGAAPDVAITIPMHAIKVDDVMALQSELNLHPTAVEAAYLIAAKYKNLWLQELLEQGHNAKEFAESVGAHAESIAALYRKLKRIERCGFIVKSTSSSEKELSVIDQMMEYIDRGINIIVEFGNYSSSFVYLLIANILTRRLHAAYIKKTEAFLGSGKKELEPQKLMIVIEEAHKFLNTVAAKQTIFGVIAREMRKYYVSLLVVDQRPSGIDDEVLSQIGTKIVAQLNDEKDIQAVLTGVFNASALKTVLQSLDTKQQALFLGHAVTMPVVVQTRKYDEQFYQDMMFLPAHKTNTMIEELF
ncbi:DUF87 domain-containing protein [bacterium]|jgi:hypothetical protein|nr:DUF87 domain-containing protein [bacterium]